MTEKQVEQLGGKLPDEFSRQVLAGCFRVAHDEENPIRLNLFAAGLRELFGHILDFYAPDQEVRACSWFVQSEDTLSVTRRQRAVYATQGGLSDDYVRGLGLDVEDHHASAIQAISKLNKFTHVRPGRIEEDPRATALFVADALSALAGLLESFEVGRETVTEALADAVFKATGIAFITETFDTIDFLAGKGYEVDPWIDDAGMAVQHIGAQRISTKFSGIANVTLHYGSRGDAAEIQHEFPFWMTFESSSQVPTQLELTESHFDDRG